VPKVFIALIVLLVGNFGIRFFVSILDRVMKKSKIEKTLRSFFRSFTKHSLRLILLIIVIGMLGVQMTSLIALLGAAGLAIGMALSGTLQNIA